MRFFLRRITSLSLATAAVMVATACAKPTFQPLYSSAPRLEAAPSFSPLQARQAPAAKRSELTISLQSEVPPKHDAYFNNPGARQRGEARPSVIISVPQEISDAARAGQSTPTATPQDGEAAARDPLFRTAGYYNAAEQEIETSLLRRGFNVLDRSKFEAKLRDMRDLHEDQRPGWWRYWEIRQAAGHDAMQEMLQKELREGRMTLDEFQTVSREVEKQSQLSAPGRRRTEDEMIDIAEVIRAAQLGEDRADYVLQINGVDFVDAAQTGTLAIDGYPATREFMNDHPGLTFGSLPNALPNRVTASWLQTEFSAKLIEVASGSIVWLGTHNLDSWAAERIEVRFFVEQTVSNAEAIERAIRTYNERGHQLAAQITQFDQQLEAAYQQASEPRKFEKAEELTSFTAEIKTRIANLESARTNGVQELQRHQSSRPAEYDQPWTFKYTVSGPRFEPDLLSMEERGQAAVQRLENHKRALVRKVTSDLIQTIIIVH